MDQGLGKGLQEPFCLISEKPATPTSAAKCHLLGLRTEGRCQDAEEEEQQGLEDKGPRGREQEPV